MVPYFFLDSPLQSRVQSSAMLTWLSSKDETKSPSFHLVNSLGSLVQERHAAKHLLLGLLWEGRTLGAGEESGKEVYLSRWRRSA